MPPTDPIARAATIVGLGVGAQRWPAGTPADLESTLRDDPDRRVRAAALGALVRRGRAAAARRAVLLAFDDPDPSVRHRACELAPSTHPHPTQDPFPGEFVAEKRANAPGNVVSGLVGRLADADALVAEMAAWALGEIGRPGDTAVIEPLCEAAASHTDALVREAAVASLGAIGDPRALPTILEATTDKPAIRRRAVLALAPFDSPEVDAALERALTDRDWQVRQAAEDLLA